MQSGLISAFVSGGKLCIILNNSLAAIEDGRRLMIDFLGEQAADPVVRHRLELVFEELISNTIKYGFSRHSEQSIHVLVDRKPNAIELVFEDDGKPFNPLAEEPPEAFSTIEDAKIGGLGLHLVAKLSAGLRYERLTPSAARLEGDGRPFAPMNRTTVSVATQA
jgi:anti-sigma regulatory factor (Ser/Thr protein kinase)